MNLLTLCIFIPTQFRNMNSPFILNVSHSFITQRQGLAKEYVALYNTTIVKHYVCTTLPVYNTTRVQHNLCTTIPVYNKPLYSITCVQHYLCTTLPMYHTTCVQNYLRKTLPLYNTAIVQH